MILTKNMTMFVTSNGIMSPSKDDAIHIEMNEVYGKKLLDEIMEIVSDYEISIETPIASVKNIIGAMVDNPELFEDILKSIQIHKQQLIDFED